MSTPKDNSDPVNPNGLCFTQLVVAPIGNGATIIALGEDGFVYQWAEQLKAWAVWPMKVVTLDEALAAMERK